MSCRVIVTGSRDWSDRPLVRRTLDSLGLERGFSGLTIVHGHCPTGADKFADEWAYDNADLGVIVERHEANWALFGKAAGPIRNQEMVDLGADIVLAFPKGASRGTRNCIKAAQKAGLVVKIYEG